LQDIMQIVKIKSKNFLVISIFLYCCQRLVYGKEGSRKQ
jgi:hypothetical protein